MKYSNYVIDSHETALDMMRTSTGLNALGGLVRRRRKNYATRVTPAIERIKAEICVKNSLEYMLDSFDKFDAYSEMSRNEYRHIFGMFGKDARKIVLESYWLYNEVRLNQLVERCINEDD